MGAAGADLRFFEAPFALVVLTGEASSRGAFGLRSRLAGSGFSAAGRTSTSTSISGSIVAVMGVDEVLSGAAGALGGMAMAGVIDWVRRFFKPRAGCGAGSSSIIEARSVSVCLDEGAGGGGGVGAFGFKTG